MGKTKIEYGDRTWNPLTGCTMVSEGCVNCWARSMAIRLKTMRRPEYKDAVNFSGNWTGVITLAPERLNEPLTWRKPQHVLVQYMGDLFHLNVKDGYVLRVFDVMRNTPQHIYQTLTKRPGNMVDALVFQALPNVKLGVSVENQLRADQRREHMQKLSKQGWRTWVSYEPALEPVDWTGWEFLDQLICGGESGPRARMMHPDWARSARDFCQANGIPFFFKQWGEWVPLDHLPWVTDTTTFATCPVEMEGAWMCRVGKGLAGHVLDGRDWMEMPGHLTPSPFPNSPHRPSATSPKCFAFRGRREMSNE